MKIGFTCGAFDLLHTGHIEMLKYCGMNCDLLIVGLHTDPSIDRPSKNKPVQSSLERFLQVESIKFVQEVIPYDTEQDLENLLNILKDRHGENLVRFVGSDHEGKPYTGSNLGIHTIFNPRSHNFSSSELRDRLNK